MRLHVRSSNTMYGCTIRQALAAAPANVVVSSHESRHSVLTQGEVSKEVDQDVD